MLQKSYKLDILGIFLLVAIALAACSHESSSPQTSTSVNTSTNSIPENSLGNSPENLIENPLPVDLSLEIIGTPINHLPNLFTQGLILVDNIFYESTGAPENRNSQLVSYSRDKPLEPIWSVEVNPSQFFSETELSNLMLRRGGVFAEGLEKVGNQLYQLTWKSKIALVWDLAISTPPNSIPPQPTPAKTFSYEGEGWGLCSDEEFLYMSNGTTTITLRNPETFEMVDEIIVRKNGVPVDEIANDQTPRELYKLNELECAKESIWANLWLKDEIWRIDPKTGEITGILDKEDLRILESPRPTLDGEIDRGAVLNGIAYDSVTENFWLTGKDWKNIYEVKIS